MIDVEAHHHDQLHVPVHYCCPKTESFAAPCLCLICISAAIPNYLSGDHLVCEVYVYRNPLSCRTVRSDMGKVFVFPPLPPPALLVYRDAITKGVTGNVTTPVC